VRLAGRRPGAAGERFEVAENFDHGRPFRRKGLLQGVLQIGRALHPDADATHGLCHLGEVRVVELPHLMRPPALLPAVGGVKEACLLIQGVVVIHQDDGVDAIAGGRFQLNWLRVLGTAELPHIDQGARHQFHAKVSLLHVFKTKPPPLELVLPRKGPIDASPQSMDGGIEEPFAPSLGALAVAGILCDVGDHARIENARAIVRGIKASVEIQIGSSQVQTDRFGDPLQGF
jgi:hypothetical protein